MKATFATVALLVLALSWPGNEAVEVQVSKHVHVDAFPSEGRAHPGLGCEVHIFSFLQENGLTFSLEAVKRLHELAQSSVGAAAASPRLRASSVFLCGDPLLPQEFLPLCRQRGASASVARLGKALSRTHRPHTDRRGPSVCRPDGVFVSLSLFQLWFLWTSVRSAPLQPALAVKPVSTSQTLSLSPLQSSDVGIYTQILNGP